MPKPGMVTKGVTFNANDEDHKKMLKFANSLPNFSRYVKQLIHKDLWERELKKERRDK